MNSTELSSIIVESESNIVCRFTNDRFISATIGIGALAAVIHAPSTWTKLRLHRMCFVNFSSAFHDSLPSRALASIVSDSATSLSYASSRERAPFS